MKHLSIIQTAACAALFVAALSPRAVKADEWDKKTYLTFSGSVQVPGAVLPAGKYVFKLLESPADRYVVQIFNERENHIFATVLAIPDYKLDPPDKTQISFYEAPAGQPEPIRAWFYPGDNYGREFVYNKHEAALIAQAGSQNVQTEVTTTVAQNTAPNSEINTTETQALQSAAVATEPEIESNKPVEAPEPVPVVTEPAPQTTESPMVRSEETTTDQPTDTAAPAPEPSSSLPATGSEMPMVLLVGLVSIAGAMTVRAARRVN
jgi:LPXTG-motif cell wall-anchored protein